MSQSHFDLQGLEIIRDISLDFSTHPLACPLLEAAELLVDIHVGVWRLKSITLAAYDLDLDGEECNALQQMQASMKNEVDHKISQNE
jgi:hypothetical protein